MRESATYQAILDEGRVEGRLDEVQALLLRLGSRAFGEPAEEIRRKIGALSSLDQAERMSDRLLDVSSWDELLAGE